MTKPENKLPKSRQLRKRRLEILTFKIKKTKISKQTQLKNTFQN